jgi:hypothetical protein
MLKKGIVFALGLVLGLAMMGTAWAYQSRMVNALHDLRAASSQLSMARPDKAGHRVKAMDLVNQAIAEVQLGIAAGRH